MKKINSFLHILFSVDFIESKSFKLDEMYTRFRRYTSEKFVLFLFLVSTFAILNFHTTQGDVPCPAPLSDCSIDKIKFFLYTCKDEPPQQLILDDPKTIKNAKFIENADFKVCIHGFTQWRNAPTWIHLREEYCKQKPQNIFAVDYFPVGVHGCYFDTLKPSKNKIGECIADFLMLLFKEHPKIKIDRFHFIGFSMGCQVCAQVANSLKSSGIIIPRITGLDPAGPGFSVMECNDKTRLNKEHGKFVDVIHSNAGGAGILYSEAHLNLYANDGFVQPGCTITDPSCSHNRALKIFTETINSPVKIIAQKCDSKSSWITLKKCTGDHKLKKEVGEHCTPPKSEDEIGIYQFFTNAKKPYAIAEPPAD